MTNGKKAGVKKRVDDVKGGPGTYDTSKDALKELGAAFDYWSGQITSTSLQMCYALVGANWVIFGSMGNIMRNGYAVTSLLLVMLAVTFNMLSAYVLVEYVRKKFDYGVYHPEQWEADFQKENKKPTTWPYDKWMETTAIGMRIIKVVLPLASGVCLIVGAIIYRPAIVTTPVAVTAPAATVKSPAAVPPQKAP